jgi:hypothetical protein
MNAGSESTFRDVCFQQRPNAKQKQEERACMVHSWYILQDSQKKQTELVGLSREYN